MRLVTWSWTSERAAQAWRPAPSLRVDLPSLNLTLQLIGFRALALLIIAGVHGAAIAAAAVALGDKGPRYDGRLTVSPAGHVDLLGAVGLIVFGLGWTKPVEVDAREFRVGRAGIMLVVVAGFVALIATAALLSALILPALTALPHTAALTTAAFLRSASSLCIWIALFSLIPVPPLAGGMLLDAVGIRVPRWAKGVLGALLLVAVAMGVIRQILAPAHAVLAALVLGD